MNIVDFTNKVQIEYGVNPVFSELECSDGNTKILLQIFPHESCSLSWIGIGYNGADANQSVVDKAVNYLKWD